MPSVGPPRLTRWEAIPIVYCSRCGHQVPEDSRFCSNCGQPLAGAAPAPASPPPSAGETTRVIDVIRDEVAPDRAEGADDTQAQHASAVESLPPDTALLVVKRGPNAGSRFLLDQPVTTAGRHPDSDIFLDDVTVSRRHVEFRRDGDVFSVHDVGSLNGTYVNREPIDSAALSGGDEVQIGKFRLVFLTGRRSSAEGVPAEEVR